MAWLIYSYQIKFIGSRFPVQVSVFHFGCLSFKHGPPLCWDFSRRCWTVGMCDVCLFGFHVILRGYTGRGRLMRPKIKIRGRTYWVRTKTTGWSVRRRIAYTTLKIGWIYMNHTEIHVCACIWRREICDSEKNGIGGMQLGWTVYNGGGVRVFVAIQTLGRDSITTLGVPFWKKKLFRVLAMLLIKTGFTWLW